MNSSRPCLCDDCAANNPPVFCKLWPITCAVRLEFWQQGYDEGEPEGYRSGYDDACAEATEELESASE